MIDNYSIKNFKIHKEENPINLKGLTILTGTNNSGKSSITQSIRLLSKVNRESYSFTRLPLKEIKELGDFSRVLNKDVSRSESIVYRFSIDIEEVKFCDIKLEFKSAYNYEQAYIDMMDEIVLDNMDIYFENYKDIFNFKYKINLNSEKGVVYDLYKIDLNNNSEEIIESEIVLRGLFPEFTPTNLDDGNLELMKIARQLANINEASIRFVPAFRQIENSNLAEVLENNKDRIIFDKKTKLYDAFIEWTLKLLNSNFKIKIESNKAKIVAIDEGIEFDLSQIGFGNTQVLPIIGSILLAKKGDLIIIENPEVHLHPRWKTNLIDLLYFAVSNGVNILIETQSLEIINRVRLKVKHNNELCSKTSLYFFQKNKFSSNVDKIEIDKTGGLDYLPDDFIDKITIDDSIELL